ncbi:MAG: ribonucleoside-diphosphate reductase subunit alpha [Armatimonadota bacterium]|nr:ribonucleoside-diphosphate reductase subunit alpha [Armatimonadota bacterium]MDR7444734.1 ribonucleoside-diphosphate reductase subunit alpha [Armatimonadota bacterium]MDR7570891.1 ribonucleoside-diphosphate reductase subunit alpha [Armatimonadota bacterium]MDR7613261.1 ribonucleoside-diphosphate reductase subunit alpha [Armatimonadota bacterium]
MRPVVLPELERISRGLPRAEVLVGRLRQDPILRDAPAGEEESAALAAAQARIHEDPIYERLSCRLLLRRLYREVLGTPEPDLRTYRAGFVAYVRRGIEVGALDPRLRRLDLHRLASALRPERDELLPLIGLHTLADRYLVRDPETRAILELPQYLFLRVAMGLALAEEDPHRWAVAFYEATSQLDYLPSTPTLFNAGTPHPQLSSCYVSDVLDQMDHILQSCVEFGQIAKYAGGIGTSITKLRAVGSPVRGINGTSSGIIPFVHLFDALIKAVSQGGRRRGTLAVYLEPWHLEIRAFLDLKRNAGDPYLRAPSLNTALWIPDEFLERVERDEPWYLFDPLYTPELAELWGEAFREAYRRRIEDARGGRLPARAFRVESARGLFREILATLQETAHPWIAFKDSSNARSMLPGVVHSANLCTEVHLPTSPEAMAVCNLASINLARHLTRDGVDEDKLARTVRLALRGLDNVIDLNFYPTERARTGNLRTRPVGLGLMGLAEAFARLGMQYGDEAACAFTDRVVELVSYCAILTSCELAQKRGPFPSFAESRWARGQVPLDTLEELVRLRGAVQVDRSARLDWASLRARVRRGIRNGTVMAIAPTATISLIAGTTPGIDPYYANVFARSTLSGKFLEFNRVLVDQLQALGLWEQVRERILEGRGDIEEIQEIPHRLRVLHRTAYRIPPEAYIRVAAVAQKWVDQGISRNLYLQDRSLEAMERIYLAAWRAGLKSTYYLFMAPRMYAEPSTIPVNKARKQLRWNLEMPQEGTACDVQCESCAS